MSATYKIIRDDQEKEFEDKAQFENTRDLLEQNGVEFEAITPDGEVDETGEETQEPSEPDVMTNGGQKQNGGMDHHTQVVEESDTDVVDVESEAETLPDRELTDDPIDWMQEGSGEFTTEIKGTTVITKKGFRVLQHKYDISTGSEIVVGPEETDHEFCRVKAWAEMPDGRRAEAHASAHVDRGDDHFLLTSMADTRAKSRALSDVTGVGAVAVEEMAGVENE